MAELIQAGSQAPAQLTRRQRTLWGDALGRFARNRLALAGLSIIALLVLVGIFAERVAPYNPLSMQLGANFARPGPEHLMGSDELGRDVLSRIIFGARVDLGLAFLTVVIAASAGVATGTLAAYQGGVLDQILMRLVDILLAFPIFLLGLALVAFLGPSMNNVVLALAITRFPRYARLIRGTVLSIRSQEYVQAAMAIGVPDTRIILQHILPNSLAPIIIFGTLDMGGTITALAGLSFLGVGIQPPTPDWGLMLTNARNNLVLAPWTAIFPGLVISLSAMGFNFIGDGLRDALDPRLQT